MTDTHIDAANRLLTVAREGRLIRNSWHRTADDGRELACMLYAMSNGVKIDSPEKCPSAWMPKWLAELIPPMFDGHSDADSLAFATRFGTLMTDPKWSRIAWDDVRREFLIASATQALESARPVAGKETYWAKVESAHRQVVEALRGNGDLAAAEAAAEAARAAAWAAMAAAWKALGATLCDIIEAEMAKVTP